MKIAVPTRNDVVDDHFGHCAYYTIYTIDENQAVTGKELLESPKGCGCKSNISTVLREKGVTLMLAGNMGQGAFNKLNSAGIEVIRGCNGNTDQLVKAYLEGKIQDLKIFCAHHEDGHNCSQH